MLRLEEHISSSKPEDTLLLVIGHIFTRMSQLFRLWRPSGGPPRALRAPLRGSCAAAARVDLLIDLPPSLKTVCIRYQVPAIC